MMVTDMPREKIFMIVSAILTSSAGPTDESRNDHSVIQPKPSLDSDTSI